MDFVYQKLYKCEKFVRTIGSACERFTVTFKPLEISFDSMGFQSIFLRYKRDSF